ncbi:DUF4267 domain-containing protein [Nakamurella lactea]|uniref:DUF4267 domain-containing protein n=1 Tax=Nakamurella lactea TaxID=459515 RepID=UPI00040144CC|nr:DUF4267 domain-containing protein [Nakamurella lactea]
MHFIGLAITWVVVVGIIGIGIAYLAKNEANAAGFGLPVLPAPDARGWWQVKGIRDVVSGLVLGIAIFAAPQALWWLLLVAAITPFGDAAIIWTNRGNRKTALAVHAGTAIGVVVASILLLISR